MAISESEKIDLLWKKLAYGVSKTETPVNKSPSNEIRPSPIAVYGNQVWINAKDIPATPPVATTAAVEVKTTSGDGAALLTMIADSSDGKAWRALDNSVAVENWIPFSFGTAYALKLWIGDPAVSNPAPTMLFLDGSGNNDEYFFDYKAGILYFIGSNLPAGVTGTSQLYIEGYRYIGPMDVSIFDSGGGGGSMGDFEINNPTEGQVLVYQPPGQDNKFENKILNYAYVEGFRPILNSDYDSFLQVKSDGTGFDYVPLSNLYLPGDLIEISGNTLNHEHASDPVVYVGTAAAGDIVITNVSSGLGWQPAYRTDESLYLMKTCELDEHGHVVAREWTNMSNQLDLYTKLDVYTARWGSHDTQREHNLWAHIDGVNVAFATGNYDNQLMIKQGDYLSPLTHSNITIGDDGTGALGITEVHATHLLDTPVFGTPNDGDSLVYSFYYNRWEPMGVGNQGEANEGRSLTETDADAIDIYKDKDVVTLQFRGLKFFDSLDNAITDHTDVWNDGVDPSAPNSLTAKELNDKVEIKFDPQKIRLYQLTDQLDPGSVGHTTFQLAAWRDNPPNTNDPSTFEKAYEANWYSYDVNETPTYLTDEPNRMSHEQWAALQGGAGQGDSGSSRELRTGYSVGWMNPVQTLDPLSIQQQIDDKVQYDHFAGHVTLGGAAASLSNPNFGGYFDNQGDYGYPKSVTTTSGVPNPIYEGSYQAHESKSIIFQANALTHYNGGAYGDQFNYTAEEQANPGLDWYNQGIAPWSATYQDNRFHTVRSVITKHINTHLDNPHGVLHSDVESDIEHWNAGVIKGYPINVTGSIGNGEVLKFDDVNNEWINAALGPGHGENNAAANIGTGTGEFFSAKAGEILQFRTLDSLSSAVTIATDTPNDRVTLDFTLPAIDITTLTGWPIDFADIGNNKVLSTLDDVNTAGVGDGQVLLYDSGSGVWLPTDPGLTNVDLAGVEEGDYLIAEEIVPNVVPAEFKWVRKSKYTIAGSLAGTPDQNGDRIDKDLDIDYGSISNNHVLAYDGGAGKWTAMALGPGQGESNLFSDYVAEGSVTGAVGLAATPSKAGLTLYVKSVIDSPTVEVDTNLSGDKVIALKVNQGNILLDNLTGTLDPIKIAPGTVTTAAFSGLAGYDTATRGTIDVAIGGFQAQIDALDVSKADEADLITHTNIDAALKYGSYLSDDNVALKHQPYEVGSGLPEFNANKLAYAPLNASLIVNDATSLSILDAGKFLQWDGTSWDIGGGGEVSVGEHTQFAFYNSSNPGVTTATQTLKPTGSAFVFIQANAQTGEEAKLGVHVTDPPEVFSISGDRPCIAAEQIFNTNQEPDVSLGWGKLYGRAFVGGITFEAKVILHFDGADGDNSFLNDGRAPVFFLPQHDYGSGVVYNQTVTTTDKYIYGNSSGYFPIPTGGNTGTNYLAANAHEDTILGTEPFGFDFWMNPLEAATGYRKIFGQYTDSNTHWFVAINFNTSPHQFEFVYKKSSTETWTRALDVPGLGAFEVDNWYHVIFQRHPFTQSGTEMDKWDLLVSPKSSEQAGAPVVPSTGEGLTHDISTLAFLAIDIDEIEEDLIVGNGNREGTDPGFTGYMDEFRMLVGSYTNYEGMAGQDYKTFLLPYDVGKSALIYIDDTGQYNLLDAGATVRRLRDQDGDTTVDVDKDGDNDNHIRFSANGIQVASFSQSGFQLASGSSVTRIENDLNNNYEFALVTQKAVKEALQSTSGSSIEDTAGTTYVHTEATSNDDTIRFVVEDDEKMLINTNGVDLKSKLYLNGVAPTEGQGLTANANGDLIWGGVDAENVGSGLAGDIAHYPSDGTDVEPATGVSWDASAESFEVLGQVKALEVEIEEGESYPGLLLQKYSGVTWDSSQGYSITNPNWDTPTGTPAAWPYIRAGNNLSHDSRFADHARWTGYWICPETRTYTFGVSSQRFAWIFVDGVQIAYDDYPYDYVYGTVDGVAGQIYAIDIQKYEDGWPLDFYFQWKHSGMSNYSNDLTGMFQTDYPIINSTKSQRNDPFAFRVPKVGIGLDEPTEALDVLGSVKATKFIGAGVNPVGAVIAYGGTTVPSGGWLFCDGATISRATYSDLYAVTGDLHGSGDGSTTFELPDYNDSGSGPQKYIIKI